MPHYRVHYLDRHGRIVGRFEFHCPSDSEAEQACEDLCDPRPKALWRGSRWIRAWPAPLDELRRTVDQPRVNPASAIASSAARE